MINNISWTSYWQAIAISLIVYYLGILYLYYRKDMLNYFTASKDAGNELTLQNITDGQTVSEFEHKDNTTDSIELGENKEMSAEPVIDEVRAYFSQLAHIKTSKEAVLKSLHAILKKHPFLEGTAQFELNKLIRYEAAVRCSMILNDDDIEGVWLGL